MLQDSDSLRPYLPLLHPAPGADLHAPSTLHACADYTEALALGLMHSDLDHVMPVTWKKGDNVPELAATIRLLRCAHSCVDEGIAPEYQDIFYVVGHAKSGLIVQLCAGADRGKLALIPDAALATLATHSAARSTVEALSEAGLLQRSSITLADYIELRATRSKPPKRLTSKDKSAKTLAKAFANMEYGSLMITQLEDFELTDDLGDLSTVKSLRVEGARFETLPASIARLPNLRSLRLSGCANLRTLPDWCSHLTCLEVLSCSSCPIETLPSLPALTSLELRSTHLRTLAPHMLSPLLTSLTLGGACFETLPDAIADCAHLTELSIHEAPRLRALPASIGHLARLETLEVYDTSLSTIPTTLGQLSSLTRLVLGTWGRNSLRALPSTLGDLTRLTLLWLGHNQLTELPEQLQQLEQLRLLDLSHNSLDALPEWIFTLPELIRVDLSFHDNPIPAHLVKVYKKRLQSKR